MKGFSIFLNLFENRDSLIISSNFFGKNDLYIFYSFFLKLYLIIKKIAYPSFYFISMVYLRELFAILPIEFSWLFFKNGPVYFYPVAQYTNFEKLF